MQNLPLARGSALSGHIFMQDLPWAGPGARPAGKEAGEPVGFPQLQRQPGLGAAPGLPSSSQDLSLIPSWDLGFF